MIEKRHLLRLLALSTVMLAGCSQTANVCDVCADAGCSDESCADAAWDDGTDGGDTDGEWQCPAPIAQTCPDGVGEEFPLLFDAAQFGEGTRFIDLAPWSVLAERDTSEGRTISVITCASADGWGIYPCDASSAQVATIEVAVDSGLHAVALATGDYYMEDWALSHLAVLCDDDSCALYGANLCSETPDSALTAVAGGELPAVSTVKGLWWRDTACAYGDGIHCFDGSSWSSPQEADAEHPLFNDMTTFRFQGASDVAVAVGDEGRIAYSGFPDWNGYWGAASPDWLAVVAYDDGYVIAGEDGAFAAMDDTWHEGCTIADEDIVDLVHDQIGGEFASSRAALGLTASGRVFVEVTPEDWDVPFMESSCFTGQTLGSNPKAGITVCGDSINVLLMDETALYGTLACTVS